MYHKITIDLSGNYVTTNTVFNLGPPKMDLKFVSHGQWSEEQNILFQHMHKKEFWILINKCGNNLKHENEDGGHGYSASFSCLRLFPHLLFKIQNSFLCMC